MNTPFLCGTSHRSSAHSPILLLATTLGSTDYRTHLPGQSVLSNGTELRVSQHHYSTYVVPEKPGRSLYTVWGPPSSPAGTLDGYGTAKLAWGGCLAVSEVHLPFTITSSTGPQQAHRVPGMGFTVSHELLNLNLQVTNLSSPNVLSEFLLVHHLCLALLTARGLGISPHVPAHCPVRYSSDTFLLTKRLKSRSMAFWLSVEAGTPKCCCHLSVGTNSVKNSAKKLYRAQQISHEDLKINEGNVDRYVKFSNIFSNFLEK